jgi:hypothetical protein
MFTQSSDVPIKAEPGVNVDYENQANSAEPYKLRTYINV